MKRIAPWLFAATLALAAPLSLAVTLRVSNQGDVQSMDPHSLNESLQLSFTGNVYESLIERDKSMNLAPALATKWTQQSPTVWRFDLRPGVKFHDGTPFTADDVVFTFKRAAGEGSDMKGYTNPIKEVRKTGDLAVEIETTAPYPILPDTLTTLAMMSKKWCEDNKAERPVDRRKGIENTASFKANGTGPFRLKERQPSVRTVLVKNFNWWGKSESNVDEIVFTPIGNDATRVAALQQYVADLVPVPVLARSRHRRRLAYRSGNATALSLTALLALARGDREAARELLAQALTAEPSSVVARMLPCRMSSRAPVGFRGGRASCVRRLALEPDNSLRRHATRRDRARSKTTRARRSRTPRAHGAWPQRKAPRSSCSGSPTSGHSIRPRPKTLSSRAVEFEPDAPLPRLGLALASIHRGELHSKGGANSGLAVALDPANALTRSYMAKVYDAEHRGALATSQLDLAKDFDPVDPTPWLYSSLQKLRSNRPVEAFQDLHEAARGGTATGRSSAPGSRSTRTSLRGAPGSAVCITSSDSDGSL